MELTFNKLYTWSICSQVTIKPAWFDRFHIFPPSCLQRHTLYNTLRIENIFLSYWIRQHELNSIDGWYDVHGGFSVNTLHSTTIQGYITNLKPINCHIHTYMMLMVQATIITMTLLLTKDDLYIMLLSFSINMYTWTVRILVPYWSII